MTALEMVGRTKQATKTAREALDAHAAACTPESHAAVVTALKASMDIADAQAEYFANGQSETIANLVAAKMKEKRPLVVNGREWNLPSATVVWRSVLYATIVLVGVINGCEATRSGKPRVAIDPEVLVLARELAGLAAPVGVSTNGRAP